MKQRLSSMVFLLANLLSIEAQVTVVDIGPHHRTIKSGGQVYREIETGMNYLKGGQWTPSNPEIEPFPGGAVFRQGQHSLIFPRNIHQGLVDLEMPNGNRLQSTILGIALYDNASGKSVLIGELKSSEGELVSANQIVFRQAFNGVSADVRLTVTKAGMEQDVILTGVNADLDPASFGMNAATSEIQILTEFISPPVPRLTVVESSTNALGKDTLIDFGEMQMHRGKAFMEPSGESAVHVSKSWQKIEGRTFLVEAVRFEKIESDLLKLPVVAASRNSKPLVAQGSSTLAALAGANLLPAARKVVKTVEPMRLADNPRPTQGLVFDYVILSSSSGQILSSGTTYYVVGLVSLTGTTVIEPCVVKFAPTNNAKISLDGFVDCQTAPFRPAIFTARDDDSQGAVIAGSAGNPSGVYATSALDVNTGNYGSTAILHDLRVAYANIGINLLVNGGGYQVRNAQVLNCNKAFGANNVNFGLQNVLIFNCGTFCDGTTPVNGYVEHLTIDACTNLVSGAGTLYFTNCAIANITSLLAAGSTMVVTGSYNGFYNSSLFGQSTVSSTMTPFQTSLAGQHYLSKNCPFLNAGTTNINSVSAMWLRYKTVFPPVFLGSVSNDTTLLPQAARGSGVPSLGFYYDPIDFLVNNLTITASTLVLTNSVSVSFYGTNGLILGGNSRVISEGLPMAMNELSRYSAVQESTSTNFGDSTDWKIFQDAPSTGTNTELRLRFTEASINAVSENATNATGSFFFGNGNLATLELSHSALFGAKIIFTNGATFAATNTLFEKPLLRLGGSSVTAYARNNLFIKSGLLDLTPSASNSWGWYDNELDITNLAQNANSIANNYNAYIHNTPRLTSNGANDQVLSSFNHVIGPLGRYYQPRDSVLIDAGSRSAGNAALYHFSTQLSEVKETNSTVDIGLHYVALTPMATNVWVEDAVPTGANPVGDVDGWNWVSSNPTPFSGTLAHQSPFSSGNHQHYFDSATATLVVNKGESFFTYVFIDTNSTLPSQIMFQYRDEWYWQHRSYWGTGSPIYGTDGTETARYLGTIPTGGQWMRLDVAPLAPGIEGLTLSGLALTMRSGKATWDYSGKYTLAPYDSDGDGLPDYFEDRNGNGVVDSAEMSWLSADTDGDGVSDYLEWLQGRNPLISGTTADTGNLINLRIYTPLKP